MKNIAMKRTTMKPIVSVDVELTKRKDLKNDYLSLTFSGFNRARQCKPGQFVHIGFNIAGVFYRRAFSIAGANASEQSLEIILKVVGRGSRYMANMKIGDSLNFLGPLGKPFTIPRKSQTALMVAGGVGYPPLLYLANYLIERGWDPKRIVFFYGGQGSPDIVDRARIKRMGVTFVPTTDDGSFGFHGRVTTPLVQALADKTYQSPMIYSCGPEAMLKAVDQIGTEFETPGELALEAPMPCGFGICLGCVVPLRAGGTARVCQEGPAFAIGTVKL